MTKKPIFWVTLISVAVVLIAISVFGKQYYDSRYVGTDYYTMVPLDFDMTPKQAQSSSGEDMGNALQYDLTAYNNTGEAKQVSFTVYDVESGFNRGEKQPQPGSYLRVSASKQLVVGWQEIEENAVPKNVLEMINKR